MPDEYKMSEERRAYQRAVNQRYRERHGSTHQIRKAVIEPGHQDIAYAAGFLDGEGYIGALKKTNSPYVSTRVAVSQVIIDPLKFMQERWGGVIGSHAAYQPNRRPAHNWILSNKDLVADLLIDVMPYLLVKRTQAELLLELACMPKLVRGQANTELIARRAEIYDRLRVLNRRGSEGVV